jgi:sarcosine oxidase
MSQRTFDTIVLGAGGMGSAATLELARRGRSVLALEQFSFGHDRGSSHGQTRIIRKAYFEHPAYVPLVRHAFDRWHDLEQQSGRHLLTSCPCLNIGRPDGEIVSGVLASATEHQLAVDRLDAKQLRDAYPQYRLGEEFVAVLERDAGYLHVEECVRTPLDLARQAGAILLDNEPVRQWTSDGRSVRVTTDRDTYSAKSLVVTAGPWAKSMLAELHLPLTVMRQNLLWFGTDSPQRFRRDRFPIFIAELPGGSFYGLPMIDPRGLKIAQHYGQPEVGSPEEIDRGYREGDELPVRQFLRAHLPEVNGPLSDSQRCIYTLTPDRHFVIDCHPEHPNVAIAAGFSGHGFKFASAVGDVLADLATEGRTSWDIGHFRLGRLPKQHR